MMRDIDQAKGAMVLNRSARMTLGKELKRLAKHFGNRPASLKETLDAVHGKGHSVALVLMTLPFLTPLPVPMLSSVIGIAVASIGLRLALGQHPHLPARLMAKQLPPNWVSRLLSASSRVVRLLEWGVRPRCEWVHDSFPFKRLAAIVIMLCGLLLALPLPVPFSNFFPAAAVFLIAASELGRDGVVYFIGLAMFAISAVFFGLLAFGGTSVLNHIFG